MDQLLATLSHLAVDPFECSALQARGTLDKLALGFAAGPNSQISASFAACVVCSDWGSDPIPADPDPTVAGKAAY